MKSPVVAAAAALLLLTGPVLAQTSSFSTLEERMTGREFRDAGLHKLTDEELANLNRWIQVRSLADGEVPDWLETAPESSRDRDRTDSTPAAGDTRGLPGGDRSEIQSRLQGSFSGWRGTETFELENGMIWEQSEPGTFAVPELENPEVVIRPGLFGAWHLQVAGYNTRVRVRRVR